ncbi:MAG: flagellar biosynthesis protein FliQ [Vibrio sp.]
MSPEMAITIVGKAIWVIVTMVSVLILPSLAIGLIVAIFQAVTQINEQTLSFFPRLIITLLCIIFAGHWLLESITDFFNYVFFAIPQQMS